MPKANFCVECGERLALKGWRARVGRKLCDHCASRAGAFTTLRSLIVIATIAVAAFAIGRYRRPTAPPLVIQRAANSPLSDEPVDAAVPSHARNRITSVTAENAKTPAAASDDEVYLCGARTKKGTPCQRRVHAAGERCFQHKGMPAILPLDKLVIRVGERK